MGKPYIFVDLSNYGLRSQYKKLAQNLRGEYEFEDCMEACFPKESSGSYLLYPLSLEPKLDTRRKGNKETSELMNIILISQPTIYQRQILPEGKQLVAKGDINIVGNELFDFKVKELWLLDSHLLPKEDQCEEINGYSMKAYSNGVFRKGSEYCGGTDCDWKETPLNSDIVLNLLVNTKRSYLEKGQEEIKKWKGYLRFRKHYMDNSIKDISFQNYRLIEAFALLKKSYSDEDHKEYLLDGHEEFKKVNKDEAVIITKQIGDSEPCYILQLTKKESTEDDRKMIRRLLRNQLKFVWTDNQKKKDDEFSIGNGGDSLIKMIMDEKNHEINVYLMLTDDMWRALTKTLKAECSDFRLGYDSFMEGKRIERQEKALDALEKGTVKMPLLNQYLFGPRTVMPHMGKVCEDAIEWQTKKSLNSSQRIAVAKALSTPGIFLLQGPPGTGKTTVIAELTAQYVMRGKRVLIASETHKAIDNAFEDIAALNLPEVRLLRLLSDWKKEGNEWAIEKQTENFYDSILRHLEGPAEECRRFEEMTKTFEHTYIELKNKCSDIERLANISNTIKREIENLEKNISKLNQERNVLLRETEDLIEESSEIQDEICAIEHLYSQNPVKALDNAQAKEIAIQLQEMQHIEFPIFGNTHYTLLVSVDINEIVKEIKEMNAPDKHKDLELEKSRIQLAMSECKNDMDEVVPSKKEEYDTLRESLKLIINEIYKLRRKGDSHARVGVVYKLVNPEVLANKDLRSTIPWKLKEYQRRAGLMVEETLAPLKDKFKANQNRISDLEDKARALKQEVTNQELSLKKKQKDNAFRELQESETYMKKSLSEFFTKYEINPDYPHGDYAAALDKMRCEWEGIVKQFEENQRIYERQKAIHKEIKTYIENGAIERDKEDMQKKLIDKANVIGMTSTGREFDKGINVPDLDLDVVIIDEVSKCSFLDLLRPILYGKTVILVGDHKQLPPMYDLKHLKQNEHQNDFEDLDETIITPNLNARYTEMVETCLFQHLFENLPDSHKTMLTHQYRFHSQIMEINPFYDTRLIAGSPSLDDQKEHGIEINIGGRRILESKHHVCFVDCGRSYEMTAENSTSLINEGEANVVVELLRQLNLKIGDSNRLSVGVICTYGRQARAIKRKIFDKNNRKHFSSLLQNKKEKLTVSTVDDFQGDERDIIILSMVRNPRNWNKNINLDFIQKFQRINVAITRPRRLLIIVGAKEFLEKKAVVKLPSSNGFFREEAIFKRIIQEIDKNGNVTFLDHILESENHTSKKRR